MKSTDFYYRLQQMNIGRKFLPGGQQANLTPEFIVWTGMLFNHAQKTQEKMKEFNLFNNIPEGNCDRSYSLRQIETLDELSYTAYQASKTSKEKHRVDGSIGRFRFVIAASDADVREFEGIHNVNGFVGFFFGWTC